MSFIYSQALAEEYSEGNYSDTDVSVQSSVSHTPRQYSSHAKMTEHSLLSRFLPMCEILTDDSGEALLMSFVEASRAKTSALPEVAQDSTANVADCGASLPASLAKYDPATHSLKTAQCSLIEDLTGCCVILPRSGTMLDGVCYQQPTVERHTSESESGFWPTPVASMRKGSSKASLTRKNGRDRSRDRLDHAVMATDGGRLNPEFAEYLMGFPIGHTDLKPLATGRFHEFVQQHSVI